MQQRERVLQHPAGPSTARRVRADPSVPNQSAAVCQTGKLRRNPFAQLMGEDVDNDEVSPLARPVAVLPKQNEVETASANVLARLTPASGPRHHAPWRAREHARARTHPAHPHWHVCVRTGRHASPDHVCAHMRARAVVCAWMRTGNHVRHRGDDCPGARTGLCQCAVHPPVSVKRACTLDYGVLPHGVLPHLRRRGQAHATC